LWLARHGETEWTIARRHTGRSDIGLTDRGAELARTELGPKLAAQHFDLVLSSPLRRALETARLAGFDPETDDRLAELDYGEYEGRTKKEVREERPGWDLWRDGCPGGETVEDVAVRMDAFLADRVPESGRMLIFGHGHALRVLTARRLALPAQDGRVFRLQPAQVGVIGDEHGEPAVVRWGL